MIPPGTVALLMKEEKAVVEYKRTIGLYLAELTMSSFLPSSLRPGRHRAADFQHSRKT